MKALLVLFLSTFLQSLQLSLSGHVTAVRLNVALLVRLLLLLGNRLTLRLSPNIVHLKDHASRPGLVRLGPLVGRGSGGRRVEQLGRPAPVLLLVGGVGPDAGGKLDEHVGLVEAAREAGQAGWQRPVVELAVRVDLGHDAALAAD